MKEREKWEIISGNQRRMKKFEIRKLFKEVHESKGITLIALVITIIVLLILARSIIKYGIQSKWNI